MTTLTVLEKEDLEIIRANPELFTKWPRQIVFLGEFAKRLGGHKLFKTFYENGQIVFRRSKWEHYYIPHKYSTVPALGKALQDPKPPKPKPVREKKPKLTPYQQFLHFCDRHNVTPYEYMKQCKARAAARQAERQQTDGSISG